MRCVRSLGEGCPAARKGAPGLLPHAAGTGCGLEPEPCPSPAAVTGRRPSLRSGSGCGEELQKSLQGPSPGSVAGKTRGGRAPLKEKWKAWRNPCL